MINVLDELRSQAESDRPIPPYNKEATTPAEVYDMDELAPPETCESIDISPLLRISKRDQLKTALQPLK